jgi:hypothetical protein
MNIPDYEYPIEQCDVPEKNRKSLDEYRKFRRRCLEQLRGNRSTSVMNQVHNLAWHTAVFKTLNEARRLEPSRMVNGAMWKLIAAGYASLMTLGIRRLVDNDRQTDSVRNVITQIEKRPEPITREMFVCYDGLPYDYQLVGQKYVDSTSKRVTATCLPTTGPSAWATSRMAHKKFDQLCGHPVERKRTDVIDPALLTTLQSVLRSPCIKAACTLADKRIAHAERFSENSKALPEVSYNDIDEALKTIVRVTDFLSSHFFYDTSYGSVVPTPQYDVFEALDQPWVKPENLPALHQHWHDLTESMAQWVYDTAAEFLPPTPPR